MRLSLKPLLLLGLSSLASAVFEDEVGHIDFHHALVGVPQVETTFFHRPRKDDKASLLYTLSDVGVVGAVNPSNGAVVWRQQVAQNITNGGGYLRAPEGENWVAAAYGSKVQAWDALSGRNVWQTEFKGEVKDLEIMELTEYPRKDVLVLSDEDGKTVLRRLHGSLGTVIWEFRETSNDIPVQVSTDITKIFVVSLHGSPSSYSLKVTALNPSTGIRVEDLSIGTKGDVHGAKDIMFVGGNSAVPIIAWTDDKLSKIKLNVLGTKSTQEFALPADTVSVAIHAPHLLQSQPHFLVHTRTKTGNKAEVYHTDLKTSHVAKAYELPLLTGAGSFSISSEGANVFFTRITENELIVYSSESHGVLARWPFKPSGDVVPIHAVAEVIKKSTGDFAVRSAAVTKADDWIMVRNGEIDWTRPEGLTAAVAAVYAEIPVSENLAKVLEREAHTNPLQAYIHRVLRHVDDLQYLPDYLASLPQRLMDGIFGSSITAKKDGLHRDTFGFNKLIVLATRRGRMYGLSTGNGGEIVWSKLVLPQEAGKSLDIKGILANDEEGVVYLRGSDGEFIGIKSDTGDILQSLPAGSLPPVSSSAIVNTPAGQWLFPLGAGGELDVDIPPHRIPKETVVVRGEGESLRGLKFSEEAELAVSVELWSYQAQPGQKIVQIAKPPAHNPIASIGRVLGDRGVNYKYLNPNTIVVALTNEATSSLSIQLVDTVSGQILASQAYAGVDANKPISCTMAENWYACSFFGQFTLNDGTKRDIKGYQVVVSDLYESAATNDRGPLGDASEFSSFGTVDTPTRPPLPHVVSQAFVLNQPITTLSATETRQGIANRQLLGYLPEAHSIVGLPRQFLDPRRPIGRDPTADEMEAEGLARYAPAIEVDPRSIISHQRNIIGVKGILAAPAIVESTSLVVAFGIDVFGTRVAPSGVFDILGKSFNKVTLVGTVLALFAGVTFLAPMVSHHSTQLTITRD